MLQTQSDILGNLLQAVEGNLRERDIILGPLEALNGVSLPPPQVALEFGTKLVWDAASWPAHGSGEDEKKHVFNVKDGIEWKSCIEELPVCWKVAAHSMVLASKVPVMVRP